jgi:Flp pilus assembly protein TadG
MEFAIVAPVFFLLIAGVIEGGRLVYAYNAVNHAAQEAGRLAILQDTPNVAAVQTQAVDAADPLSVNSSDVTVEVNNGSTAFADRTIGDRLAVSVTYEFVPFSSLVFGSTAGMTLTGHTELMVE